MSEYDRKWPRKDVEGYDRTRYLDYRIYTKYKFLNTDLKNYSKYIVYSIWKLNTPGNELGINISV